MRLEISGTPKPYVIAHRGNLVHCPENTLAAFRRAINDGADLLETDLNITADGRFVCIHDQTVDRTTNGAGAVRDMSLEQLQKLSANCGRTEFEDQRVPTLQELFDLMPADVDIALELKTDEFLDPAVAGKLVAEIKAAGRHTGVVLLSFSMERLQSVRHQAMEAGLQLPAGFITPKLLLPRLAVEIVGPLWPWLFLNPLYVWWAHRKGLQVCPLDPAPDTRLWYYRWLGCDAVLSDDPGATLRRLGRRA